MVGLRDTRSGVHQIFGPARVVRQKKQTLARLIEPPDWRDKRQILRQTIIDRFPLLWIAARGHQAPWLVQHEIDLAPCADRTAVDRAVCKREIHPLRSEEHTSELQSLMRNSYAVFCLKKKKKK